MKKNGSPSRLYGWKIVFGQLHLAQKYTAGARRRLRKMNDETIAEPATERKQPLFTMNLFVNYITHIEDQERVLTLLHSLIDGKTGKTVAKIIVCALECGLLNNRPTFKAVTYEFGDIGSKSNYYFYMNALFTEDEKRPIIDLLTRK